jgi:hypothetical protein
MAAADALSVQVMHKVAQLGSRCVGNCPGRVAEGGDGQAESAQVAPPDDVFAGTREQRSVGSGRPTGSRSPHPGVRRPPVTAVESAGALVESQHAVPEESRTGVPVLPAWSGRSCPARRARRRSPRPAGACPPSCGCRSPPSGRSGGTVRQLARCARIRLEPGASAHVRVARVPVGVHAPDRVHRTTRSHTDRRTCRG